jgi:hypothetical protein
MARVVDTPEAERSLRELVPILEFACIVGNVKFIDITRWLFRPILRITANHQHERERQRRPKRVPSVSMRPSLRRTMSRNGIVAMNARGEAHRLRGMARGRGEYAEIVWTQPIIRLKLIRTTDQDPKWAQGQEDDQFR